MVELSGQSIDDVEENVWELLYLVRPDDYRHVTMLERSFLEVCGFYPLFSTTAIRVVRAQFVSDALHARGVAVGTFDHAVLDVPEDRAERLWVGE